MLARERAQPGLRALLGIWFQSERLLPVLLILPSVVAIGIFVYGFIGWTLLVSLSRWTGVAPDYTLVGLENYLRLFNTPRFQNDLRNTLVFTLFFVGGSLLVGLLLAILLDQKVRGESFFRTVYLFPMAVSFVVTGVVWRWLLTPGDPRTGDLGLNQLFGLLGLHFLKSRWFTDPTVLLAVPVGAIQFGIPVALFSVILAAIWQMSGFCMAMYLAALRAIPDDLREAARVDGASEFQLYRDVIIPLLKPTTISAAIVLGHISLKIFDLVFIMTGSGPAQATDMPAIFMYETTFRDNRFAQGAAIAIVMLILVSLVIVPYLISTLRGKLEW
jgi:glucose/mannose transport system permease protein